MTHSRDGKKVCVRDVHVLRRLTDNLLEDVQVVKTFTHLASPAHFHADDLNKVFRKYMYRVETMVGNEVSRQLLDDLRLNDVDRFESLRQAKRARDHKIKTGESAKGLNKVDQVVDNAGKVQKKKRRRRKKKNW